MTRRVVITGIGVVSALGDSRQELYSSLKKNRTAVREMPEWKACEGMKTNLGAPLRAKPDLSRYPQKLLRSTGGVAQYAIVATDRALNDAQWEDFEAFQAGNIGIAYGSGFGGDNGLRECTKFLNSGSIRGLTGGVYHKLMAHTCAAHVALCFGIRGRLMCTSTACASGSQAVGYGYESILSGAQDAMICGGAEELSVAIAALFDVLCACTIQYSSPDETPRPFDAGRDGMVVGEGACTLVLEELAHAQRRNAPILAEVVGYSTNCDAIHITNPHAETITRCFADALSQSKISARSVGYVNAHATGTKLGDIAESSAMRVVYGENVPVSSIKGHLGHPLGACASLELAVTIETMLQGWIPPTRNLTTIDKECEGLRLVRGDGLEREMDVAVCNTVAFGGINTSIILKKFDA